MIVGASSPPTGLLRSHPVAVVSMDVSTSVEFCSCSLSSRITPTRGDYNDDDDDRYDYGDRGDDHDGGRRVRRAACATGASQKALFRANKRFYNIITTYTKRFYVCCLSHRRHDGTTTDEFIRLVRLFICLFVCFLSSFIISLAKYHPSV